MSWPKTLEFFVAHALLRAPSRLISTLRPSRRLRLVTILPAFVLIATASQTKSWQESDYSDFEKVQKVLISGTYRWCAL